MLRKLIKDLEALDALDHVSGVVAGWVQRATRSDAVENALSGTWLGHKLHPVLTDLPIGAWTMASALDVTAGQAGADVNLTALSDLSDGIRCPRHGSVFRLSDGRVTRGPSSVDQPSWPVRVDGGRVLVRSSLAAADA
jgi:hypothetical protein